MRASSRGILSLCQCIPVAEGMAHSGPQTSQNVSAVPYFILKMYTLFLICQLSSLKKKVPPASLYPSGHFGKTCHGARSACIVGPGPRAPWSWLRQCRDRVEVKAVPVLSQSRALLASAPCSCLLPWALLYPLADVCPAQPNSPSRNPQDASPLPSSLRVLIQRGATHLQPFFASDQHRTWISVSVKRKLRPRDKRCLAPRCTARRVVGSSGGVLGQVEYLG